MFYTKTDYNIKDFSSKSSVCAFTRITNRIDDEYSTISKCLLCLFLQVFENLLWVLLLFALKQTRSKDDGQVIGTHLVDVFVLSKPVC